MKVDKDITAVIKTAFDEFSPELRMACVENQYFVTAVDSGSGVIRMIDCTRKPILADKRRFYEESMKLYYELYGGWK